MALTLPQLIDEAAKDLQDIEHIRWPRKDLLEYFNAAQRTFADQRPDQMVQARELVLPAGWQHQLPGDALELLDISNNANTAAKRITKTDAWVLDAVASGWRAMKPAREVIHFMRDMRNPREFLVYPPVLDGVTVRAVLSITPVDLTDEQGAPSVPARWMDALRHFVLYRAWSKDAEFGGNQAVAAAHLQLFNDALGTQVKASNEVAPTI